MNCYLNIKPFAASSTIQDEFINLLKDILYRSDDRIQYAYEFLSKYNSVEDFINYIETTLSLIRGFGEGTNITNIYNKLNIKSLEESIRAIVLCELAIDLLKHKNNTNNETV